LYPRRLRHRGINLLQAELGLNHCLINRWDHVWWSYKWQTKNEKQLNSLGCNWIELLTYLVIVFKDFR
jgi:hypothetical protein